MQPLQIAELFFFFLGQDEMSAFPWCSVRLKSPVGKSCKALKCQGMHGLVVLLLLFQALLCAGFSAAFPSS